MTPSSSPGRLRARRIALLSAALLAAASGCQDGGPTAPSSGSLVVQVIGLPAGTSSSVVLSGPNGFSRTISRTDTIAGLVPGTYTLRTEALRALGAIWAPSGATQEVAVEPSKTPQLVAVAYVLSTGSLRIGNAGLPSKQPVVLTLTGPNGFSRTVAAGDTVSELRPGDYTLAATPLVIGHHRYAAPPAVLAVAPSLVPAPLVSTFALASTAITVAATGLPANTLLQVTLAGPGVNGLLLRLGDTLWTAEPGTYTAAFNSVVSDGQTWAPDSAQRIFTAIASETPITTSMGYTVATGTLELIANGLPTGAVSNMSVVGPTGVTTTLPASRYFNQLPGSYVVTAPVVVSGGVSYTPTVATQTATVTKGAMTQLAFTYTAPATPPVTPPTTPPPSGAFDLVIDGMYVTQAVQNYQGTIPLVANRDALVRVFVRATATNSTTPQVRVRVMNGSTAVATYTISAPVPQVPVVVDESTLNGSWNVVIPAALMQPGLSIVADVDPANAVVEGSETNNSFPATGTPAPLTVVAVPPVDMTFVPVLVTASGLQGTVNDVPTLMQSVLAVHPISSYTSAVHATFTTGAPALDAGDASGGWLRILSEIQALRVADGSTRMYYGLVKVPYTSGVAGYGYVGYPAAIGWDYLPSGAAVLAHEIGHNFGRTHAPCGNPASPDRTFPNADGSIGVYGWSARRNVVILPSATDIMGYCGNQWISEYTYRGVMDFRGFLAGSGSPSVFGAGQASGMVMGTSAQPSLLVWGRIHGRSITLEPSFQMTTRAAVPRSGSAYTARGLDASGAELFSLSFDGEAVADAPNADRAFAFAVPLDAGQQARLAKVVVTGRDGSTAESVMGEAVDAPTVRLTRSGSARARLRWDATRSPMVVVRDPANGKVLSFARGGDATIAAPAGDVEVTFGNRRGPARRLHPE